MKGIYQQMLEETTKTVIDLARLRDPIPFQWMVNSFVKGQKKAICVPFLEGNDVTSVLDTVVGTERWSSEYKELKGTIYCRIGIKVNGEWVYKEAAGSVKPGGIEKDKALETSALKRAGKRWGIGIFLDNFPNIWVDTNEVKNENNSPHVVTGEGSTQKVANDKLTDFIMSKDQVANILAKCYEGKPKDLSQATIDSLIDIDCSENIAEMREKYKKYAKLIKSSPLVESIFNTKLKKLQLIEAVEKLNNLSVKEDIDKLIAEYPLLKEDKVWEMILEYKYQLLRTAKAQEPVPSGA